MRCPTLRAHVVGTKVLRLKIIHTEKSLTQKIIRTEKSFAQKSHTYKLEAPRYNKDDVTGPRTYIVQQAMTLTSN